MAIPPFSAIILAGGQSSRMGRDKALLCWQGIPLWQHQQNVLRQTGCDDILLSHPQFGVTDVKPGFGPLSGLQSLLPQCRHQWVLVIAVDMPLLTTATLHTLLTAAQQQPAYYRNSALPCVLHKTPELIRYLDHHTHPRGKRSVSALLQFCEARAIDCPQPDTLININTPAQWQTLISNQPEKSS
ncbi:molybdenum cofactor guanylyltransferase [Bacterioplanoides pacificum]|uniref:Molybdenum cofactor guanylyltransferase n=1 Tax=Bacterioplanoides pacificum TaxID=1171596 RepID=A0ABV7VZA2_9GAMM